MGNRGDIIVRSDNELKLFIEVRGGGRSSADWAAKFRRNLVEYQVIPRTEYFLLALPDYLYLWKEKNALETVPPHYIARTFNVLQRYMGSSEVEPRRIAKDGLHMALVGWLHAAMSSAKRPPVGSSDAYKFLVESGLLDAIDNGEVSTQD